MRLTVERDAAVTAVAKVKGAAKPKDKIPMLGFVLLSAGGGELTLTATNLELQARTTLPCQVDAAGSIAVPAGALLDVLKSLPAGGEVGISLTENGGRAVLVCGRARLELPLLPASDFPIFPEDAAAASGEMPAQAMARMIDRTRFAISTEETRYMLNGLYLHAFEVEGRGKALRAVATNGHQLSYCDIEIPPGLEDMPGTILPRPYVAELRRMAEGGGPLRLSVSSRMVRAEAGGVELTGKIIDAQFPQYWRAMPTGEQSAAVVSKTALLSALRRALIVISDKDKTVTLRASEGNLRVEGRSFDLGSSADDLTATYQGEPFWKNFNASYLVDMAELISGDEVTLTFREGANRLVITEAADEASYMLLVAHVHGGQG